MADISRTHGREPAKSADPKKGINTKNSTSSRGYTRADRKRDDNAKSAEADDMTAPTPAPVTRSPTGKMAAASSDTGSEKPAAATASEAEKQKPGPASEEEVRGSASKTSQDFLEIKKSMASLTGLIAGFSSQLGSLTSDIKVLKDKHNSVSHGYVTQDDGLSPSEHEDAEDGFDDTYAGDLPLEEGEVSEDDSPPGKRRKTSENQNGGLSTLDSLREQCGLAKPKMAPVDAGLAEVLNTLATDELSEQSIAERKANILDIENCDKLVAPRMNECVWDVVKDVPRRQDAGLQNIQKTMMKGLTPIIQLGDRFMKAMKDDGAMPSAEEAFTAITDGVALILASSHNISLKRRDLLRPHLKPEFKAICSTRCPITTELFGDELPKRLKDITEANKIGIKVADQQYRQGYSGARGSSTGRYFRGTRGRGFPRSHFPGRGAFLAHSRPFPRRRGMSPKQSHK